LIDEGVKHTFYRDLDGDGHGDPKNPKKACKPPPGYVAGGDDCLDEGEVKNPASYWGAVVSAKDVNPGATEKCNGVDDNCSAGPLNGALTPSGIDENFADKGQACSSDDSAKCNDSIRVCSENGNGTMCLRYLTWGAYGIETNKMTDVSGYNNHSSSSNNTVTTFSGARPPVKLPFLGGSMNYVLTSYYSGSYETKINDNNGNKPFSINGPQITIAAWVTHMGKSGWNQILDKGSYMMMEYNNVPYCRFQLKSDKGSVAYGPFISTTTKIDNNKATHVACTYSAASCKASIYVNGVLKTTMDYGNCGRLHSVTTPLYLGRMASSSSNSYKLKGMLSGIGIYDVALSAAQVKSLATSGNDTFLPNHANYDFCDNLDNDCDGAVDENYGNKGSGCSFGAGTCKNSGNMKCDTGNKRIQQTVCSVTGKPNGTACNDGNNCTHSDTCTGGDLSKCTGSNYSCSGTCRSCNGSGGCNLSSNTCYIASPNCDPGSASCSGSCYNNGQDSNSKTNSTNSGNVSCSYCNPSSDKNSWSNRPSSWTCRDSYCAGVSTWNKPDKCNGSGSCSDKGQNACNDSNVCTNDTCSDASGCKNTNNNHKESCYTGPPGTLDVGICHAGTKTCSGGGFGGCVSQQTPTSESCNSKDDDCDGTVDEENASGCSTFYKDADGDGFGINSSKCLCGASYPYTAKKTGDCDDSNKNAFPGNIEKCNSFDDNCVNGNNEDNAQGCTTYYLDNDNDGYGQSGNSKCKCAASNPYDTTLKGDCDDTKSSVHPNAKEWCNGVDDDCQGGIDEDYDVGAGCSKGAGQCKKNGSKICTSNGSGTKCSVTGKPAGTICYDGNNCTHGDVCSGGDNSNCSGTPYSCNDGKSCTNNVCINDRSKLCTYPVKSGQCLIGGSCYSNGQKQSSSNNGACKYCNSNSNQTQWSNAPSNWQCRPAKCSGLTYHKADYCGGGNGVCQDKGTENCNKGNVCKNYGCTTGGCNSSNKGNGTKCGGEYCSGDTWYHKDQCQNGSCKDYGTQNCNGYDNSCRNGYCSGGCKIQNYSYGTKCGGENCSGKTYNKKDYCNGSGSCNDGGTQNCNALSTQCRAGMCSNSGCWVKNYSSSTKCASGYSSQCSGNTWYYQDYCNGSGSCSNKGSKNCDSNDTTCRDWYCSGGCTYTNKSSSTVCVGNSCVNSCTKKETTYCNGSGSCSKGGGHTSCGGNRCSGSNCTSSCSSNGQCCDTSGNNRTCIHSKCNNRQSCGGTCDGNDHADCYGGTCVNCSGTKCQSHGSGWHCYNHYGHSSVCGCSSYDQYNNCTGYHKCWRC